MLATAPAQPVRSRQELLAALESTSGLRRARQLPVPGQPLPTGLPALDALLGGGLPAGRITELVGARSTGRTSLALATVAATQARGEVAAWVDLADALSPPAAAAAGVDLSRLLWARCSTARQALLATDRILNAGGFRLVVLDLGSGERPTPRPRGTGPRRQASGGWRGPSAWVRLARDAEQAGAGLLLLGQERSAGTFASLSLATERARTSWQGRGRAPRLLLGLTGRVTVQRDRRGPEGGSVELTLFTAG